MCGAPRYVRAESHSNKAIEPTQAGHRCHLHQLSFEVPVDNSAAPFRPQLLEKPNAKVCHGNSHTLVGPCIASKRALYRFAM